MPSFTDATGREFEAVITLSTAIRLQKLGVNLNKPIEIPDALNADWQLLGNTIYIVFEQSIKSHGLTEDTFVDALAGDALAAASAALWEAIVRFSQPPMRAALRKLWSKGEEVATLVSRQIETAMDSMTPETILTSLRQRGNSQASLASNQAVEHSAS